MPRTRIERIRIGSGFTGARAGQHADESDVSAGAHRLARSLERARAADFDHVIDAAPAGLSSVPTSPNPAMVR